MDIVCENCRHLNSSTQAFCKVCKKSLIDPSIILDTLARRQEDMEVRHQSELRKLKDEISALRINLQQQEKPVEIRQPEIEKPVLDKVEEFSTPQIKDESILEKKPSFKETTNETSLFPKEEIIEEPQVYVPSQLEIGLKKVLEPLHAGFSLLNKLYTKYKEEEKLPIFFMTIAGILAILFGFGYLLQYSLVYLGNYAEIAKIGLGFAFAFASGGIGIRLYRKNEDYQEYGSALISLGLILNYLLIYFLSDLGNFPILSSSILGFSLIILNTAIAIFLSLRFETKIIAVLFLLGGALAPFYLNSTDDGSLYYLYLWLLTIGANTVAHRIKWKTLHYLSFIVSLSLLAITVFAYQPGSILFTVYYHLFAYLFFYFTFFQKFTIRKSLDQFDILILSANLSFFLYNLYSSHVEQYVQLGLLYSFNAIVFGAVLFRFWKSVDRKIKLVFFIVIGSFIGFAIPALVHHSLMGLFWSIEAIVLIILGFIYAIPLLRQEGYLVLAIALVKLALSSGLLIQSWDISIWNEGFLNYAILGIVISILWYVVQRFSKIFTPFEHSLFSVCKEIIPLWLSSIFLISAYGFIGVWAFNLAVIPTLGLIYWRKKFNTHYSDRLALLHLFLLLASITNSVIQSESIHLSDQFLYAQISILELMLSLWFLRKYYELLDYKESSTFAIAHAMRIAFFVILPLIFIHISRRHAIEFISPAIWAATLMAYFMHRKLKYKALLIETNILAIGAVLVGFSFLNDWGLIAAIVSLLLIFFIEKSHTEDAFNNTVYKELITSAPYLILASIAILHFVIINENPGESALLFAFLLLLTIYFKDRIAAMNKSHKIGTRVASFFNLAGLVFILFEESAFGTFMVAANLVLFGLLLQNKGEWYSKDSGKLRWTWAAIAQQFQMLLFYALALTLFNIDLDGVLATVILVVHAILVLFVSLKNQLPFLNKVSFALFGLALLKIIFNDIRDFDTAEKVIVLIVIGILLLGASYAYLKLKKHFENQRVDQPKEKDIIEEQES